MLSELLLPAYRLGVVFPLGPWRALGILLVLLSLLAFLWLLWRRRPSHAGDRSIARHEVLACCLLLAIGALLRIADIEQLHAGRLTMDEAAITRTYLAGIVSLEPIFNGASYLTHALLLDAWYSLFGFSTFSPRYFTVGLGFAGLLLYFASLRLLLGVRSALWSTALLSISAYAIFFSTFALEAVQVFFILPLNLLLWIGWLRRPTPLRALLFGLSFGLGCFTYPGVILGVAALALGCAIAFAAAWLRRREMPALGGLGAVSWRSWSWCVLGFSVALSAGIALHLGIYATEKALFAGGGGFGLSARGYWDALRVVLADGFVGARSWHLPFKFLPVFELTLWPWAMLGAVAVWNRRPSWAWRGTVLSIGIAVLLVPFTGAHPGMRRALYALLPFAALAGCGVCLALDRLGRIPAGALLLLAVAHPVFYQLALGRVEARSGAFGGHYATAAIPEDFLLEQLEGANVWMLADEFRHARDRGRHGAFAELASRYGALKRKDHTLRFIASTEPWNVSRAVERSDAVLLSWEPCRLLAAIAWPFSLCYRVDPVPQTCAATSPSVVRLASPRDATHDYSCPWSDTRRLASRIRLGPEFTDTRAAHALQCLDTGCGSDRGDSLWVHPGTISLDLKRPYPDPDYAGDVDLVIRVADVDADRRRRNQVRVNGALVGILDRERVGPEQLARFEIPTSARRDGEAWRVTIAPDGSPDSIGWSLRELALEPQQPLRARIVACGRNPAEQRLNQALAHLDQGRYASAVSDLDAVLELEPSCATAYEHRGMAQYLLGNREQGLRDFKKLFELQTDPLPSALTHARVGWILANHGASSMEALEAFAHAQRSVELFEHSFSHDVLALAYLKLGEHEQALEHYDSALSLDPRYAPSYRARGDLHRLLGNTEAALADYRTYLSLEVPEPDRASVERLLEDLQADP